MNALKGAGPTWMDRVNHKDLTLDDRSSDRYLEMGPPKKKKKETILLSIQTGHSVNAE
jgi:hypothetical protein